MGDKQRTRRVQPADWRCGTRVIDQACPCERVLYCYFSAPGVLCHFEKAHPSAHGVPYYRANSNNNNKALLQASEFVVLEWVEFRSGCDELHHSTPRFAVQ